MKYDPKTCAPFDDECPGCGNVIQQAGSPFCDVCEPMDALDNTQCLNDHPFSGAIDAGEY